MSPRAGCSTDGSRDDRRLMSEVIHSGGARDGAFETVTLENAFLRAVILPQLGGRVWELEDRVRGRQWIWHRDDVPLSEAPTGSVYDDVWAGGWEELFPNDAPGLFEARELPDHGEWWTLRWTQVGSDASAVRLSARSHIVRASLIKEFHLAPQSGALSVSYRIRNHEERGFHFLFKQHLPIRISPSCRLRLPGGRVQQVNADFSTILAEQEPFGWPNGRGRIGGPVDLQVVRDPFERLQEFVYVRDLPEPWCEVSDLEHRARLRMSFDADIFPFVWLFLSYGGWRGTYTAVLEPCTSLPKDLTEAVRLGQAAYLGPGEEFNATVTVGLDGLGHYDP
jgi:hypothetical protein